jgi:hypothetical protein
MCTKLRVNLFLIVLIGSIFYYYIGKCEMQTNLKSQDFDGTHIKNDDYSSFGWLAASQQCFSLTSFQH